LIAEIEAATSISVGYRPTGEIALGTPETADELREISAWRARQGLAGEWLDEAALRRREPAVAPHFTCGIAADEAGSVVLARMTAALARAAERHGADIREHDAVLGVTVTGGRAVELRAFGGTRPVGTLVIAAGAWSRTFGEALDFSIPTVPVRGQMIAIADAPIPIRSVLAGAGGYLVPRADGTIAVGATEEPWAGFDTRVTPAGLVELVELVTRVAPSLAHGRFVDAWAGLRPGTEDGELIVGPIPHLDNVWVATGHFRSGALLAPATAELLASSLRSGTLDERLRPFDPARLV
jgi:glycine oxidase